MTTGMKKEGKIQIFISEKKIWEAGEPFCELKKNGNSISKEEKNFLCLHEWMDLCCLYRGQFWARGQLMGIHTEPQRRCVMAEIWVQPPCT